MTSEKRVDESWKEQVEREKRRHQQPPGPARPEQGPSATREPFGSAAHPEPIDSVRPERSRRTNAAQGRPSIDPIEGRQRSGRWAEARGGASSSAGRPDFGLFLSSLSMQALIALGEAAHPATGQPQEDLEQARYLIDTLGLLQEKTQGNLTAEEASLLDGLLYELRMKYVAREKQ